MLCWPRFGLQEKGDLEKAIADLDATIQLDPNSPRYYEISWCAWIHCQDYDRGVEDFNTAIRLNPRDPAAELRHDPRRRSPLKRCDTVRSKSVRC